MMGFSGISIESLMVKRIRVTNFPGVNWVSFTDPLGIRREAHRRLGSSEVNEYFDLNLHAASGGFCGFIGVA